MKSIIPNRALCVALGLSVVLLASPRIWAEDWSAWRTELEAERDRLKNKNQGYDKFVQDLAKLQVSLEDGLRRLPAGAEMPALLKHLGARSDKCRARLMLFDPGEEELRGPLHGRSVLVQLQIQRLSQAACVARSIGQLDRIVSLDTLEVETGAENSLARLRLTSWSHRPESLPSLRLAKLEMTADLPGGAPKDLLGLQAEVRQLRVFAAQILELEAERKQLALSMGAVSALQDKSDRSSELGTVFAALRVADPHPATLRFDGDQIVIGGQVVDESLRDLLVKAKLPTGMKLDLSQLTVLPSPAPVDLATLPNLSLGRPAKTGKGLVIHAADVDAIALRSALRLRKRPFLLAEQSELRLTGTIVAKSAMAALAALGKALPAVGKRAELNRKQRRGRGRKVSLQLTHVDPLNLLGLLSDVGGVNLIAPGDWPQFSVEASNVPWDSVLTAIADRAGRRIHKRRAVWYLLPKGEKPNRTRGPKRPRLRLALRNAWAAEALSLIGGLSSVRQKALCGDGVPLDLQLRNVTPAEAVEAVRVASGASLRKSACSEPVRCQRPLSTAGQPNLKVVALATSNKTGLAYLTVADRGTVMVQHGENFDGAAVQVRQSGVVLEQPGVGASPANRIMLNLSSLLPLSHAPPWEDVRTTLARLRLAATLTGLGPAMAVIEDPRSGRALVVREGAMLGDSRNAQVISIKPGRIEGRIQDGNPLSSTGQTSNWTLLLRPR